MPDFNIRSDSVNVEQIMRQIRARIREKRGVDYTEQQIRELAAVKLERFLDPTKVRSELLQQFREGGIAPLPNYAFEDTTLFESSHASLRWLRRLFRPFLRLIINVNQLIHVLHLQADINTHHAQYTGLSYEILHNLVLEVTRLGIEVKNLKMRVESISGRLDFGERRARALESVVQYRPGQVAEEQPAAAAQPGGGDSGDAADQRQQPSSEQRRRRRRRRGRRGGAGRPGAGDEPAGAGGDARDAGDLQDAGDLDEGGAADAPATDTEAREAREPASPRPAGGEPPSPAAGSSPGPDRENQ